MRTADPINIKIRDQAIKGRRSNEQTVRQSSLEIAKDMLKSKKLRFTRIILEKTYLLNNICSIRTSKGKILQGANKTCIKSRVTDRRAMRRKFRFGIKGSIARIAGGHVSTRQDFLNKRSLGKKQTIISVICNNAKEEGERVEVWH